VDHEIELGIAGLRSAEEIGRGGNAIVYRAHDIDHDRWVAVKVLHHASDEATLRRFDRERKTMGRLSAHEGIVTILTSGVSANGNPYLVMPLLTGGSLEDELHRRGRVAWPEAVATILAVAEAVAAAHELHVVHRDLKPANILIGPGGRPLVADFGISQILEPGEAGTTTLSLTAHYAAPDLLDLPPPHSVDLYALGVTLYEMGAGAPPYMRDDNEAIMAFLRRVRRAPLPDLRAGGLPEALIDPVRRALAKEAAERPASMHEFAQTLRSTLDLLDTAPAAEADIDRRSTVRIDEPPPGAAAVAVAGLDIVWLPEIEFDLAVDDVDHLTRLVDEGVRWALERRDVFVTYELGRGRFVQLLVEQNGDAYIETSAADTALRAGLGWATAIDGDHDLAGLALPLGLARRRETIVELLVATSYRVHGYDHRAHVTVATGLAGSASPVLGVVFEPGLDADVVIGSDQELLELLWHALLWPSSTAPARVRLGFGPTNQALHQTIDVDARRQLTLTSSHGEQVCRLGLGWHADADDPTSAQLVFPSGTDGREHDALEALSATVRALGFATPCGCRIVVSSD
jgi:tRNA A-37 threonylcarbamoyl transferase component Bud32